VIVLDGPVPTAGRTIDLDGFSVVSSIEIHNEDTTNYITVTFTNIQSTAKTERVLAGKTVIFQNVSPSVADLVITANNAEVFITGIVSGTT
jgi:hypothetical protein